MLFAQRLELRRRGLQPSLVAPAKLLLFARGARLARFRQRRFALPVVEQGQRHAERQGEAVTDRVLDRDRAISAEQLEIRHPAPSRRLSLERTRSTFGLKRLERRVVHERGIDGPRRAGRAARELEHRGRREHDLRAHPRLEKRQ